ncbi:MAG: hypothetical protein ABI684_04665, partial [Nitrospirota bacterium]
QFSSVGSFRQVDFILFVNDAQQTGFARSTRHHAFRPMHDEHVFRISVVSLVFWYSLSKETEKPEDGKQGERNSQ